MIARNVRIDDAMWLAVQEKAAAESTDVSKVIRSLLAWWLADPNTDGWAF